MNLNPFKFFSAFYGNLYEYKVSLNWQEASKAIDELGFAVIQLYTKEEIEVITQKSKVLLSDIEKINKLDEFLAVGRLDDAVIRNKSTQIINELVFPNLKKFLPAYEFDFISGIHLLKPKGAKGVLNPHQDSSLVDETAHKAYFFWLPITNTGSQNGTLEVIPKSHLLEIPFRSLNIPWTLVPVQMKLWKFMKKLVIPSGHAVVFHSALIHGSGENKSNSIRIAINSFIKPKEAPLLHYYTDADSNFKEIESFFITPDFFYNEDILKKPDSKYQLNKKEPNINSSYTLEQIDKIFN